MHMVKALLKRLFPQRVRLWRYAFYEKIRYYPELIFSLGTRIECPFCAWHFRRLCSSGFTYPVLMQNQVVGATSRLNVVCPRCKSHDRERLLYLFIKDQTRLLQDGGRVLHIAPEPQMRKVLLNAGRIEYLSADLYDPDAMIRADLLSLPFRDQWFNVVLCNHVLEHVDDDRIAMREIYRVLKPGGWTIVQVPIALALKETIEDPSVKDENERIRLFGQRDHVRMYAADDYQKRLQAAGFDVSVIPYPEQLGSELVARYALVSEENVHFCRRPMTQELAR
jgi:SAM-dependent methyltransferase